MAVDPARQHAGEHSRTGDEDDHADREWSGTGTRASCRIFRCAFPGDNDDPSFAREPILTQSNAGLIEAHNWTGMKGGYRYIGRMD